MTRRVLMIAYYFPPLGGIGSVRALKFAQYLPEFSWEPVVVAPRNGTYYRDPTLSVDERRVVRTSSVEISRSAKRVLADGGDASRPADVGTVLERVQRMVRRWVYRPDAQIGWYPFALAGARKVLREQNIDAIFSSSFPITAHLVARRLHREFRVPWVAEFRDLWTDVSRYDSPKRRRLDQATERSILESATVVVTVSEGFRRVLSERGARNVAVVTNGFDEADLAEASFPTRPVVTYMGTYYPDRQELRPTLEVLGELAKSGPLKGLTMRFVGELPESLRQSLVAAGLAESTDCTGFVSHREALRHLADSTLLLLAGPVSKAFPRSAIGGHIAAKVFEYLGSGRPILYVGDVGSDVETLIRQFPGVACVQSGDRSSLRQAALSLARPGRPIDRPGLHTYTRRALTHHLTDVLDAACGRGSMPSPYAREVAGGR